jgi:hypothetical protein
VSSRERDRQAGCVWAAFFNESGISLTPIMRRTPVNRSTTAAKLRWRPELNLSQ